MGYQIWGMCWLPSFTEFTPPRSPVGLFRYPSEAAICLCPSLANSKQGKSRAQTGQQVGKWRGSNQSLTPPKASFVCFFSPYVFKNCKEIQGKKPTVKLINYAEAAASVFMDSFINGISLEWSRIGCYQFRAATWCLLLTVDCGS